jgi:hypothetical protein
MSIFCFYFYNFSNDFNPHALFTIVYIFLFAETSPSYDRQLVLSLVSYLFPVTFLCVQWSAETRLENSVLLITHIFRRPFFSRINILNQHLYGCILNYTLRQLIIQVQTQKENKRVRKSIEKE